MNKYMEKYSSQEEIREDIARMYHQFRSYVYHNLLTRLGCTKEVAEELTQDIFLRVQVRLNAHRERVEYPQALLLRFVQLVCQEWFNRSEDAKESFPLEGPDTSSDEDMLPLIETIADEQELSPEQVMLQEEKKQAIQTALNSLSSHERETLQLKYYQGYTDQEVANTLGKATSTIGKYKKKALVQMRSELQQYQEYTTHTREEE